VATTSSAAWRSVTARFALRRRPLQWNRDVEATDVRRVCERTPARAFAIEIAGSAPARLVNGRLFLRTSERA